MAEKRLEMIFKNQLGTTTKITVDDVRDNITGADVQAAMELVINKNIFRTNSGELVEIESARIVATDVTEIIA
ncbi:DUF2922 domain-containing protein [Thermotalea metallivorans]|uniref:DUF2922 domain-containing protein n=1 Tax=Thermotalea metallivorans TaxID=520762 RepID=A0A140L700_9FIRM|nr:DUF2922 domain-containing protein [Thermotalea metallivorans]KXG76325.1 hypothetical protein AN619_12830 [Thermotalea metallivorans]